MPKKNPIPALEFVARSKNKANDDYFIHPLIFLVNHPNIHPLEIKKWVCVKNSNVDIETYDDRRCAKCHLWETRTVLLLKIYSRKRKTGLWATHKTCRVSSSSTFDEQNHIQIADTYHPYAQWDCLCVICWLPLKYLLDFSRSCINMLNIELLQLC